MPISIPLRSQAAWRQPVDPAIGKLKEILDAGTIGQVFRISQERLGHGGVNHRRGVHWSLAPRDIAVMIFLMGEPPGAVSAHGAGFLQPGSTDDVHLELGFSGGRSAHLHACWYWPQPKGMLQVSGSKGMIVYDEADQTLTLHRKFLAGDLGPDPLTPMDFGSYVLYRDGELRCRQDDQPVLDGPASLDVIRVLEWTDSELTRRDHGIPRQ